MPPVKKSAVKSASSATKTKPATKKPLKDPAGGLTDAGREHAKKTTGANLKPGVQKVETPDDMKRKGSFLRRHFTTLSGPLLSDDGKPTRLALQAKAWGEKPPKTEEEAAKLAAKGERLLVKYKKLKDAEKAEAKAAKKAERDSAKAAKATK